MGRFLRRRAKDIRVIPADILSLRAVGNERRELGITPKQEKFARLVAGGDLTYVEACIRAGFSKKSAKNYAKFLMNPKHFPRVVDRVRQIKEELAIRTDVTFENHVAKMAEIRDAALEKGNFTAAVAAEKSRGQAAGLYVSRSEILVGKIDQMSRDEVLAEIKRLQAEFPALAAIPDSSSSGPVIDLLPEPEPTPEDLVVLNNEDTDAEEDSADHGDEDLEDDQVQVEQGD